MKLLKEIYKKLDLLKIKNGIAISNGKRWEKNSIIFNVLTSLSNHCALLLFLLSINISSEEQIIKKEETAKNNSDYELIFRRQYSTLWPLESREFHQQFPGAYGHANNQTHNNYFGFNLNISKINSYSPYAFRPFGLKGKVIGDSLSGIWGHPKPRFY